MRLPRRLSTAVKNIVGRDMHKRDIHRRTGTRHRRRCLPIDAQRPRLVFFGAVHSRIGGGIDHGCGRACRDGRTASGRIIQISILAAQKGRIRQVPAQLLRDLPCGAKHQYAHALPSRLPTPSRLCSARHQSSFSRYQRTVRCSPSSTVTEGSQPSSCLIRDASIA